MPLLTAGSRTSSLVALVAAWSLLALSVLPMAHAHVADDHDDHHAEAIHRHLAPHHPVTDTPEFESGDEHEVVWLDTSYLTSSKHHTIVVFTAIAGALSVLSPAPRIVALPTEQSASAPDPPWRSSTGLRAPPASV